MELASNRRGRIGFGGSLLRGANGRHDDDQQQEQVLHLDSSPAAAILVAGIAVHAVVDISGDTIVSGIGGRCSVTVGAGEHGVVRGVGVTGCADTVGATMLHVEPGVVEGCASPCGGVVTSGAGGWETSGYVVGVCCASVLGFVAGVAIGGRACIHTIDMARGACDSGVRASEGEWRLVVIEDGAGP